MFLCGLSRLVSGWHHELSKLQPAVRVSEAYPHAARLLPVADRPIHEDPPFRCLGEGPASGHLQTARGRSARVCAPSGVPSSAGGARASSEAGYGGGAGESDGGLGGLRGGGDHHLRGRGLFASAGRVAAAGRSLCFPGP